MNKTPEEAKAFALAAGDMVDYAVAHDIEVGVAPTFVCLATVKENISPKCIVAAQNCNEHPSGAYTGEVSIPMLKAVGISWVILGHSERREYNGETSEACNLKIKALLAAGMTPVYCCGESLETFEKGETKSWVAEQIKAGTLKVFDCSKFTVTKDDTHNKFADVDLDATGHVTGYRANVVPDDAYAPDTEVFKNGAIEESSKRSAPYFELEIDGITCIDAGDAYTD